MAGALGGMGQLTELRRRLMFLLGALLVYRIGTFIPVPGVNPEALAILFDQNQGSILDMFNMFSGGALERASLFALGVMPYISASIIVQLMTAVVPQLEQLKKEGEAGRRKITQYTRYGTVFLATFQAIGISMALQGQTAGGSALVVHSGVGFVFTATVSLVTGTMFLMWLGEQITERGIGNGISLLIFIGIVADLPNAVRNAGRMIANDQMSVFVGLALVFIMVMVTAGAIVVTTGQRRNPVQYPRQIKGRGMTGGTRTYLPLRVNHAGVIPIIFASSMLYLPMLYAQFQPENPASSWIAKNLSGSGSPWYNLIFFVLIIFFAYFYVAITFDPVEVADNMKKYGGFIPGIRAGRPTEKYLAYVLSRLTAPGSLYLGLISLLPAFAWFALGEAASRKFPFGGTSILIIVGVGLDTVKQIESQLQQRNYEGFLR